MGVDADAYDVQPVPDLQRQHEAQEETVSSLLRSSSARFTVMREVDYASLPPIRKCSSVIHEQIWLDMR